MVLGWETIFVTFFQSSIFNSQSKGAPARGLVCSDPWFFFQDLNKTNKNPLCALRALRFNNKLCASVPSVRESFLCPSINDHKSSIPMRPPLRSLFPIGFTPIRKKQKPLSVLRLPRSSGRWYWGRLSGSTIKSEGNDVSYYAYICQLCRPDTHVLCQCPPLL